MAHHLASASAQCVAGCQCPTCFQAADPPLLHPVPSAVAAVLWWCASTRPPTAPCWPACPMATQSTTRCRHRPARPPPRLLLPTSLRCTGLTRLSTSHRWGEWASTNPQEEINNLHALLGLASEVPVTLGDTLSAPPALLQLDNLQVGILESGNRNFVSCPSMGCSATWVASVCSATCGHGAAPACL